MVKRMFVALELPESCTRELERLDPEIKGVRWLRPEQMHLTLSFLGDVGADAAERLKEVLAEVRIEPFFLPIEGVGAFGGERPSVIWAGVGRGHPHLFALYKRVQDAVLRAGLEPDLRSFHPHITIARARGVSRAMVRPFLRRYAEAEIGLWKVEGFTLFSSKTLPEGAVYRVEMEQKF